jgi:hypothetical protein
LQLGLRWSSVRDWLSLGFFSSFVKYGDEDWIGLGLGWVNAGVVVYVE